jgi:RNA polymerase sigma-70 factor (ECF subfamily)
VDQPGDAGDGARAAVDATYRTESRRVLATLVRLLGDFDLAEEALHDAFAAAVERWGRDGVPANPRAWLVSAGRFRAVDALRRRARADARLGALAARLEAEHEEARAREAERVAAAGDALGDVAGDVAGDAADDGVADDRLRLIFTCCHPALAPDARAALTLREVCGLTTEEIARAFLARPPALAQRIVRAKAKIRDARIPYRVPGRDELPARLAAVLQVVYLVFGEGYAPTAGDAATRPDLSAEAIRLGRLLVALLPEAEAVGLLALMLLHEARRPARADAAGELVLLEAQDRGRWDQALLAEGCGLAERALRMRAFGESPGPYALQAAIAAVHAEAPDAAATDWAQIVGLYDVLLRAAPTPVVALNRAAAVAMRDGPAAGLALVDALLADPAAGAALAGYHLAHAARADLCRRLGRADEARAAYARALALARQAPEQRFLARRLAETGG